jgi:hypothetical protein
MRPPEFPPADPEASALNAMMLCVSPEHWEVLPGRMVLMRTLLPKCPCAVSVSTTLQQRSETTTSQSSMHEWRR